MKKTKLTPKIYTFHTIDQDEGIERYEVEAFTLREAKEYRAKVVGNTRCGKRPHGRIYTKKY